MEINYILILILGIVSMIVGALWYGPLFGKTWLAVIGATELDLKKRAEMQKKAGPLYALQLTLTLLQLYILAHFVKGWVDVSGMESAAWIWLGFVMPTIAGSAMWNNNPTKMKWTMFLLQSGYQLVMFIIFGFALGKWG